MEQLEIVEDVFVALRKIDRAIDIHSKKLAKRYGLTGPQLMVLKEIKKSADTPISQISRNISLSQATVTSILDRLEKQGFAKRQRSSIDKRKVNLCLTEKAIQVLSSNPTILQEEFYDEFEKLEEWEKTMILSSLQRLSSMLNAENIKVEPVLITGLIE